VQSILHNTASLPGKIRKNDVLGRIQISPCMGYINIYEEHNTKIQDMSKKLVKFSPKTDKN
jgi:hypothetical protein